MILTPSDYITVRTWLDVEDTDVTDEQVALYAQLAENEVRLRDPEIDTWTGDARTRLVSGLILLTAAYIAPTLAGTDIDVATLKVGDTSISTGTRKWSDVGQWWRRSAFDLLFPPVSDLPMRSMSYFGAVKTATYRRGEGAEDA